MIFFFSYFWVATQFQPQQIADDLKKYGGYVPGVRPGKPTADFLDFTMTRLTFAGAVFLTVIAILPQMLSHSLNVPYIAASFFGGTSLLIIVGVILDTMRQIETHLIQRHYDGFLRKGRIRGRFDRSPTGKGEAVQQVAMLWMYAILALLLIAGTAIFIGYRGFPGNICISINEEVVHGIGGPKRIQYGDIVKLDIGVITDGWVGDTATTVPAGMIDEKIQRLLTVTETTLEMAITHAQG